MVYIPLVYDLLYIQTLNKKKELKNICNYEKPLINEFFCDFDIFSHVNAAVSSDLGVCPFLKKIEI